MVLVMAVAVLVAGLTVSASAKKPDKPPGGGKEEPRYTIVDLIGDLEDGGGWASSINELGQVAGVLLKPDGDSAFLVTPEYDGDGNPVVWFRDDDSDGINDLIMDIGTLVGDSMSDAYGVNNSGQVVGFSYGETAEEARMHAFLWDSSSGMVDLGTLDLGTQWRDHSFALDISNSGYVVGCLHTFSDLGSTRGFIIVPEDTDGDGVPDTWFQDDGQGKNALMIDLGTLPGDILSSAAGVNDSGQVVGTSHGESGDSRGRGFLITPEDCDGDGNLDWFCDDGQGGNALMIELSPLGRDEGSSARAINSSGQVAGSCLWEVDAEGNVTATDLGKTTGASSINDAGQVVGFAASWKGNRSRYTAFLWENGTTTKLIDLIANSEGIADLDARGINEYGEIVGNIHSSEHAYIALPIPAAP